MDTYGLSFVELYIGNPLTTAQGRLAVRTAFWVAGGFGLDQVDKHNCSNRAVAEANNVFNTYKAQGAILSKDDIKQVYQDAFTRNTSRVDQFSDSISTMLGSMGKK